MRDFQTKIRCPGDQTLIAMRAYKAIVTELSESRVCKIHTRLIERLQERLRVAQDRE